MKSCLFSEIPEIWIFWHVFYICYCSGNSPNFLYNDFSTLAMGMPYQIGAWPLPSTCHNHSFIKISKKCLSLLPTGA